MIAIENINALGRTGHVNARKYEAMRDVLQKVLPADEPGMNQSDIRASIRPHLPNDLWPGGANAPRWVKTVQLGLEAKGLVIRDSSSRPIRWRRT